MAAEGQTSGIMTERVAFYDTSMKTSRGQTIYRRLPYYHVRYDDGEWAYESIDPEAECMAGYASNDNGIQITSIQFVTAPDGRIPGLDIEGGGGGIGMALTLTESA